jgi:hypothetical protein
MEDARSTPKITVSFSGGPMILADMNYLAPMAERPRNYTFEPPPGVPRSNISNEAHSVPITDMRPLAGTLSLDANGFALLHHKSAVRDFFDEEEVRHVYYPEVEQALKQATGAYRVHVFDHTTHRRVPGAEDRVPVHVGRCGACTSITPPARGRSACAIFYPMKPTNC